MSSLNHPARPLILTCCGAPFNGPHDRTCVRSGPATLPTGGPWPLRRAPLPTCGAQYGSNLADGPIMLLGAAGWRVPTCALAPGHDGSHEDAVIDAPATVAWSDPS